MPRPVLPAAAFTLAVALALSGCSRQHPSAEAEAPAAQGRATAVADMAPNPTDNVAEAAAAAPMAAAKAAADAAPADDAVTVPGVSADAMGSAAMTQDTGTRRFVRTAQVDCQVRDVQRASLRIEDLAARFGGFVTRNDLTAEPGRVVRRPIGDARLVELTTYTVRGDLQVRVPSDRAQAFLRAIAAEMEFLDRRHFEAVDAQFELLRRELARRRHDMAQAALREAAARGGKLVDRAEAIDRRVDQQTARDEALIEQRTYEDRVAFATLDVSMRQPEQVRRAERPDIDAVLRREGPGFFARIGDAFVDGWRGLLDVAVGLASAWPLWFMLAAALGAWRAWRRRRA